MKVNMLKTTSGDTGLSLPPSTLTLLLITSSAPFPLKGIADQRLLSKGHTCFQHLSLSSVGFLPLPHLQSLPQSAHIFVQEG